MSFDWRKFLTLAKKLAENTEQEDLRSSISRAYYSAYNVLRNRAGYNGRREKESHKALIDIFKNLENDIELREGLTHLEDNDIKQLGNILEELRNERNKADYDGTIGFSQRNANEICEKVQFIFDQLDKED